MKKVLLLTFAVVFIPFFIIIFFIKTDDVKFIYTSNMSVRVKNIDTGNISSVPFEDYIVGVLAGEMPVSFEIEALKAQAVAARSYVMKQMVYNKDKDYDVVDTVMNQVYLSDEHLQAVWKDDYTEKINKIKTAVNETYNEYLEYDGEVAEALFFSTSVGYTENSEEVFSNKVPYLQSVSSTWDEISPVYQVNYNFSLDDFYKKLDLVYSSNINIEILDSTSTGRVKKLKINGVTYDGNTIVNKLKLKSNHFRITQNGSNIKIITKGYGHGVGMSQYGAQAMALKGYNYKEILSHYYKGTTIKKI